MKKKTEWIYELESENLSNLGGPMGSGRTYSNWIKYFKKKEDAQKVAEADYTKQGGKEKIVWTSDRRGGCVTQDLRYVMYNVMKVELL